MGVDMRTSASFDAYETPIWLVEQISAYFGGTIDLDPCTSARNPTGAVHTFTNSCEEDNGLSADWTEYQTIYVNSPYGAQLKHWVRKCVETHRTNPNLGIIQLLPARFGSGWFKEMAADAAALGVFNRRLSFTVNGVPVCDKRGKPCTAQFDTCLVYYGPQPELFRGRFSKYLTYWSRVHAPAE